MNRLTTPPGQAEMILIILNSLPVESPGSSFPADTGNQFALSPSHPRITDPVSLKGRRFLKAYGTVERVLSLHRALIL